MKKIVIVVLISLFFVSNLFALSARIEDIKGNSGILNVTVKYTDGQKTVVSKQYTIADSPESIANFKEDIRKEIIKLEQPVIEYDIKVGDILTR